MNVRFLNVFAKLLYHVYGSYPASGASLRTNVLDVFLPAHVVMLHFDTFLIKSADWSALCPGPRPSTRLCSSLAELYVYLAGARCVSSPCVCLSQWCLCVCAI